MVPSMAQLALVRYQFYHLWARLKGPVLAVELQMILDTSSEVRKKIKNGKRNSGNILVICRYIYI